MITVPPKHSSKKTASLIEAFHTRLQAIEGLQSKVNERAAALAAAQTAFRDDPTDSNFDALAKAKHEHSLVLSAIPGSGIDDLAAIRSRFLETPEFFNALQEDLQALQEKFTSAVMEARKAFAAAVTDHILKGFPYNLFDAREITGAKAAAALKALEALEHRSVQIGSAHTGARQRATGSMASMDTATILSFLNNAPEDLK